MPQHFHRLENALKRANEFIDVGKKLEALEILCDVLRSRKHRTWQKNHADIMVKYLELCVELRKSYVAKEGIYQYKIICQQTQIKSFEDIVRTYLQLAEEKAEAAKNDAQAAVILDVDDLDNAQTPENILLSAVSSEDTQDRTDRVVLLPWVKFLWESYRQCLDLLKNNARTERLYHDIAHKAFTFCMKFNRKTEFRKLCDNLHAHLDILKKQQQQLTQTPQTTHNIQNIINLSNPDSQALHLETRLLQLDCAINMELWQEAYKATDDIRRFNLMNLSKKPQKPQLMASYYQKLALVFLKANCPLFHAAALFRHFVLTREMRKNIKEEELQRMASKVVAATLSMPIPPTRPEIDKLVDTEENVVENHQRNLASLLGLTATVPSRSSLVKDLKRMGVLGFAYEELQQLYEYLEVDFHPLLLCKRVENIVSFMEKNESCPDLKQYTAGLKDVTVIRLLKEISQVYQSIEYKRLIELCPFVDHIYLEKMIVDAARRNDLQVRIDHRAKALHFGTESAFKSEEIIEGPHLQSMPSSQMRQQLVTMYSTLQRARSLIEADAAKSQRDTLRKHIMGQYEKFKHNDHANILARQDFIEARKEELEQIGIQRDEEERKVLEDKAKQLRQHEEERMKKEGEERTARNKLREENELRRRMALDTIEQIKRTEVGQKLLETLGEDGLVDMKVDEIKSKQWEQLEKERKDLLAKQEKVQRKVDHMERAKRLEEISLLEAQAEKEKVKERELFEEAEVERVKAIIAERELALQHKDRLLRMRQEATKFANSIKEARYAEYTKKLEKWQERVDMEKDNRLTKRRNERKEKRRREYEIEKKKRDEERKKEEERILFAERKRLQEEQRAEMDAVTKKQQERDAEIERKQRERDENIRQERGDDSRTREEPDQKWRSGPARKTDDRSEGPAREEPSSWRRAPGGGGGGRFDEEGRVPPPRGARDEQDRPRFGARDIRVDEHSDSRPDDDQGFDRSEMRRVPPRDREERPRQGGEDRPSEGDKWRRSGPPAPRGEERGAGPAKEEQSSWRRGGGGGGGVGGGRPEGGRPEGQGERRPEGQGERRRFDDERPQGERRRFDDERGPRRDFGPRDDDRSGPRRDFGKRDDEPRSRDFGGRDIRRGEFGSRDDERPRGSGRGEPRRDDDHGPRGSGREEPRRDDDNGPRGGPRGGDDANDSWRKDKPSRGPKDGPPQGSGRFDRPGKDDHPPPRDQEPEAEGWTTVKKR